MSVAATSCLRCGLLGSLVPFVLPFFRHALKYVVTDSSSLRLKLILLQVLKTGYG